MALCARLSLRQPVMRDEVRAARLDSFRSEWIAETVRMIPSIRAVDSSFLSAFLMTYRTFCTSHRLLDLLIERFLIPEPEGLTPDELKEWENKKKRPIRARSVTSYAHQELEDGC